MQATAGELNNPVSSPWRGLAVPLTEIRAYCRALYLRENANLDWTDIGAKVKKLMEPVSVLDEDFEEKIAGLPSDEARASVMEHAIRAHINTRLPDNPVFFKKLSEKLERIIQDLRNHLIDAAEAAQREAAVKRQFHAEDHNATEHGLSPVSFAIYELIRRPAAGLGPDHNIGFEEGASTTTTSCLVG